MERNRKLMVKNGWQLSKLLKALWESEWKTIPSTLKILSSTVMAFQNCGAVCCKVLQECVLSCPPMPVFYLHFCVHSEQVTKEAVTSTENNTGAQSVTSSPFTKRVPAIPQPIVSYILVCVPAK